ncbi:uncharacterized protein LACBIDRAFT_327968 [Laccaria bicolor S238N-H82]|uniref:Predicted protein n=1 Tax=Laccaria bicolor (strain S238N-H82 / ATCC MYA-4686) TaxID=486041 RepID=B0DDE1_LACBS|nr:uncharacterized protein LACBIDRAFT_327968 [Laccaria bicolor S238N-H82]EDR07593.1 predicted protein [Laccaria bicolor S238N-H82]|eukprot:XP_001881985.1 predicted protein [Laccaria bicolor S238N-H82]
MLGHEYISFITAGSITISIFQCYFNERRSQLCESKSQLHQALNGTVGPCSTGRAGHQVQESNIRSWEKRHTPYRTLDNSETFCPDLLPEGVCVLSNFVRAGVLASFTFGHFLSGLAPGRFAKIQFFCPDRDQTVSAIDRGPLPLTPPITHLWGRLGSPWSAGFCVGSHEGLSPYATMPQAHWGPFQDAMGWFILPRCRTFIQKLRRLQTLLDESFSRSNGSWKPPQANTRLPLDILSQ